MEFKSMKLNDLQESYSNYEPNITAFMQLTYNGTLQI